MNPGPGIDFEGVIIPMVNGTSGRDTQFSEQFVTTTPHPGAIEEIHALAGGFDGNVWIVSKAGPRMETMTVQWLRHHDFFRRAGLNETHVRFCRERPEKQPICHELSITHFIDDRVHIMQVLKGTVANLYLFGDKQRNKGARRWTMLVEDWAETREAVLRDLANPDYCSEVFSIAKKARVHFLP